MKIIFIFSCSGMLRDVPECSGMFHVPGFIDAPIDTITKVTNLVRFIKEQKYYFESERLLLYNVQVISLLVHLQMNH